MSKDILQRKRILTKASSGSSISTPVSVANGGTGLSSYTIGDLLYASGATTLSKLADIATGNALISGGVGVAPSWGKIDISTHVSGLGTGVATALAVNTGSAGAPVLFNGALGTPSSGTLTNATGLPEGGLSLTDITTNNVSNSAHGFFPKLTANSVYYVNNSGILTALTVGAANTYLTGNGVTSAPTWTSISTGLTVGTTAITSGTANRVLYEGAAGNTLSDLANFTMGTVASGYLDVPTGLAVGGSRAVYLYGGILGRSLVVGSSSVDAFPTSADYSTFIGGGSGGGNPTGNGHTALGYRTNRGSVSGGDTISIGAAANYNGTGALNYTLFIGSSYDSSTGMVNTASNQAVFGMPKGNGYTQFYFGQGVSAVTGTPSGVTFNATPGTTAGGAFSIFAGAGSGSDKAGGVLTLAGGRGTGAGAIGVINLKVAVVGASSSTLQSYATVLQITDSTTITTTDAVNYVFGSTTGTKLGTATTQKIGFWNVTPIVQPSGATQAAPAAYATGAFGLDSDANMQALYDLVVAMRTALVNVGIMKGSA